MRVIYFDEVRADFLIGRDRVIFLGSLYLFRHPKSDNDLATKGYVDEAFKTHTTLNLGKGLIDPSTFPAFMGDIRNKAGSNVFELIKKGKAGRYVHPVYDANGRVKSGKTKLTFTDANLKDPISIKLIDFSTYVSVGHKDNKGLSYLDFTKKAKGKYLAIYEANTIIKPIRIENNIYEPTGVINEHALEDTIGKYVDFNVFDYKKDGYKDIIREDEEWGDGSEDTNVIEKPEWKTRGAGGMPWKHQYDFAPAGSGLSTVQTTVIGEIGGSQVSKLGGIFVDKDQFRVFNTNNKPSKGFALRASGEFDGNLIWQNSTDILPPLNNGESSRNPFVIYNRHFVTITNNGGNVKILMATPNGNNWDKKWIEGPTMPFDDVQKVNIVVSKEHIYFISMYYKSIYKLTVGSDITKMSLTKVDDAFSGITVNSKLNVNTTSFIYDNYLYIVPGHQEHFSKPSVPFNDNPSPNEYYRCKLTVGVIGKLWEVVKSASVIKDAQRDSYVYNGKVYLVAAYLNKADRKMTKISVEDLNLSNFNIVTKNEYLLDSLKTLVKKQDPRLVRFTQPVMWLGKRAIYGGDFGLKQGDLHDGEQITNANIDVVWETRATSFKSKPIIRKQSTSPRPPEDTGWFTTKDMLDYYNSIKPSGWGYYFKVESMWYDPRRNDWYGKVMPLYRNITQPDGSVKTQYINGYIDILTSTSKEMPDEKWHTYIIGWTKIVGVKKPDQNDTPPWPMVEDKEPYPVLSIAASKGRLFITNGYRLISLNLDGGLNNYDKYLNPYYYFW